MALDDVDTPTGLVLVLVAVFVVFIGLVPDGVRDIETPGGGGRVAVIDVVPVSDTVAVADASGGVPDVDNVTTTVPDAPWYPSI